MPICKFKPCSKPFEYGYYKAYNVLSGERTMRLNSCKQFCSSECKRLNDMFSKRDKRSESVRPAFDIEKPVMVSMIDMLITRRWE